MQSLDVISVNIWQIVISLANLLILFLILKKFLFKPVKNVLSARQSDVDTMYSSAEKAKEAALENKAKWEETLKNANARADEVIQEASETAGRRGEKIIADAKEKADSIIRQAENEAELHKKKSEAGIKTEIVNVSALLTEKMLKREIKTEDHRTLIDSVIEEIGDNNDGNE